MREKNAHIVYKNKIPGGWSSVKPSRYFLYQRDSEAMVHLMKNHAWV